MRPNPHFVDYISQLIRLCQSRKWPVPEYWYREKRCEYLAPQFTGTVLVNGEVYTTKTCYRNVKAAKHAVAKLVLESIQ